jgi:hypothetical protein
VWVVFVAFIGLMCVGYVPDPLSSVSIGARKRNSKFFPSYSRADFQESKDFEGFELVNHGDTAPSTLSKQEQTKGYHASNFHPSHTLKSFEVVQCQETPYQPGTLTAEDQEEFQAQGLEQRLSTSDTADKVHNALDLAELCYKGQKKRQPLLKQLGVQKEHPIYFGEAYPQAIVCEMENGEVVVSVRGTKTRGDILVDLRAYLSQSAETGLWTHRGFQDRADDLSPYIKAVLEGIVQKRGITLENLSVSFVGHSLGGAVAQILAYGLNEDIPVKGVTTFGSPKGFCRESAQHYNETLTKDGKFLKEITHNFYKNNDWIPYVGPLTFACATSPGKKKRLPSGSCRHVVSAYKGVLNALGYHPKKGH